MRNGMVSTSTCTLAKGDGKLRMIGRGGESSAWGWKAHSKGKGR